MTHLEKQDILDYIRSAPNPVTKREIARAFHIKGGENRVALKQILKALENEEIITKQSGDTYSLPNSLPNVCIMNVTKITTDGDIFGHPAQWNETLQGPPPRLEIIPDKKHFPRIKESSRALVRLSRQSSTLYEARIIKVLDDDNEDKSRILGLIHFQKNNIVLLPTNKKTRYDFDITTGDLNGAKEGDLALAELLPSRGLRRKKVRIIEVIGRRNDPKAISLISLHEAGLSETWPSPVLKETTDLKVPSLKGREDLRDTPLVTIDGADARDFDDAVFAEKTENGFHLIVAIADVAYYVRHGSALDEEAQRRGNSTYFPDRVVPMLPEALSNDLCSLRPNEPRATLAAHLWIDDHGKLIKYEFKRALIRSHARLVYEQVQAAIDGDIIDDLCKPLLEPVLKPLYAAYAILDKARQKRGALDLDLPEHQILIDKEGNMTGIKLRARLDAHKMIEEFMILANVAAAKAIEARQSTGQSTQQFPCVYRIHDKPKTDKLESVREFVESFGISLPKGQVMQPAQLNGVLQQASKLPYSHLISTVILRSQSQAVYSAENIGHFGLALQRYAHFTSPIRRYADLLIHRSLISAYSLGPGSINDEEISRIDELCAHISTTERTSMGAERSAVDRFTAGYLSQKIGAEFSGRISGVTRFGLFVSLDESGADGLVPMKSMGNDYYIHDEKSHALIGRRHNKIYRLGAKVQVRLKEADGLTGSTVLELCGESLNGADIPGLTFKNSKTSFENRPSSNNKKYKNTKGKSKHKKKRKRKT